MKLSITVVLALFITGWAACASAEGTSVFKGEKFIATITNHCPEGYLSCDKITFVSKSRKTGKGITLHGETVNVNCPNACDFRGYRFKNGDYTYSLTTNDFDVWHLNVFKKDKVIASDQGTVE